ncbi:conserved protein, unknown function [Plasmodium ovale wallikeri]|uniref:DUF4460 domain-containing protein n=1 Tax=Plasmodium ovale wallikeri TaxID=864142 RepID=A0A1A8ZJZ6_PLAOA|nr:conserved protein, unknown function [Plasmodium ovale wallikeri]SBT44916.1 conserved protein, unknown function [Plasmodium ovale wallikeri]
MLLFFYKEVHPDLTQNLPEELKKVNNESLSILNSYIDILSSSTKEENNIFVKKNLIFFKVFENSENKIIKGRYKNIVLKLQTVSNNLSIEEKEKIVVQLIYDIKKSLEKIKDIKNTNFEDIEMDENIVNDFIYSKKKKENGINALWEDLMNHVKNKEALYQPCEEENALIQKRKNYFYYIKKKLQYKYERINNKKRRKEKIKNVNRVVTKIVQDKFPDLKKKKKDEKIVQQSYEIIQNGFDPNLIFFHKDIKDDDKKKKAIENLCGIYLIDDADKWLLENCLKLLKNHQVKIPLVIYLGKTISLSSSFGYIYVTYKRLKCRFVQCRLPINFYVSDLFAFLENNLCEARRIREKVLKCFDSEFYPT